MNPPGVTQIIITATPDGQVQVTGPIQNKILSLGILEIAKKLITDFDPKNASNLVIPRNGGLVPPL